MKLTKKSLVLLLCLVMAVSSAALGTIAYLTDTQTVVNTFTVGKVDITLDEEEVDENGDSIVDENGDPVVDPETGKPNRTEEGNEYHLIPGKDYIKDPTVTVKANSEESYVRMRVVITDYADLKAAFEAHGMTFDPAEHVTGWDEAIWPCVSAAENADGNLELEFRYAETVSTMDPAEDKVLEPLFTAFTVPGVLTGEDLETLDELEIQVTGEAIQAETFADADAAWAAFSAANATTGTTEDTTENQ